MPWPRARALRPLLGFLLAAWGTGCEESRGAGEERAAQPRLQQVGSADGPLVDEDVACERYREALLEAVESTSCEDEVTVAECPELIRPAGSAACTQFSEESLDVCEEALAGYEGCNDFSRKRCILVSVLDELTPGCVPPNAGQGAEGGTGESEAGAEAGVSEPVEGGPSSEPTEAGAEPTDAGETDDPDAPEAAAASPEGGQTEAPEGGSVSSDASNLADSGDVAEVDSGSTTTDDDTAAPVEAAAPANDAGDAAP